MYLTPFRSYRSLLFKFWILCVFEPPFESLGTMYDVRLRLIGKRILDFLSVLIELFSLRVTAEALRAKISLDLNSAILFQDGQFDPKFQVEEVAPPIIFARIVRPVNALQLHSEPQKNVTFLPRCMECRRGLMMRILSVRPSVCPSVRLSVCPSVRPSVKRVHCDKTEESYV